MKYLVDANLLCEPTKPQRVQKAVEWLQANVLDCVTDAVVMGEIWRGIDKLPAGRKRANLEAWFVGLRNRVHCHTPPKSAARQSPTSREARAGSGLPGGCASVRAHSGTAPQ